MDSRPSKKKLLDHVVSRVAPHWYDLGITLLNEDQESHLDIIESGHGNDKEECCKKMFWYWLSTNTSATWKQLLEALRSPGVKLPVVAADLEKMLTGTYTVSNYASIVFPQNRNLYE